MNWNKILSIIGILTPVLSIVLIHIIPRGNWVVGPLYTIILIAVALFQLFPVVILFKLPDLTSKTAMSALSVISFFTLFSLAILYQYIFNLS